MMDGIDAKQSAFNKKKEENLPWFRFTLFVICPLAILSS